MATWKGKIMIIQSGIQTASKGIAIGKAYIIRPVDLIPENYEIRDEDVHGELNRFELSLKETSNQLALLAKDSDILTGHLMIAKDNQLRAAIIDKIKQRMNAEQALKEAIQQIASSFEQMEDPYMKERALDIWDIGKRIMQNLKKITDIKILEGTDPVIVIAKELYPSELASMDPSKVAGIVTEQGGILGHVSIMAGNLGIPCLVGVTGVLDMLKDGEELILDASAGQIMIHPDQEMVSHYTKIIEKIIEAQKLLPENIKSPVVTRDHKNIELLANVSSLEGVAQAVAYDMDGIGLLRSEFLYMGYDHYPTEEEQYLLYRTAVEKFPREVIIRTLDIGGDKKLPYDRMLKEENPALGYRGIRVSLKKKDIFKSQLRAILRASAHGNLKIVLPMVTSIEEYLEAKEILDECKQKLTVEGYQYYNSIELGMMVETPASVINIKDFAKTVDFFSIGTNDLTQYILAIDRNSLELSKQCNSYHPAVIRSVHRVIEAAHMHQKKVSVCGELASHPKAIPLLLGMGLDAFSVPLEAVASIKEVIRNTNYQDSVKLAKKVLKASKIEEVMNLL